MTPQVLKWRWTNSPTLMMKSPFVTNSSDFMISLLARILQPKSNNHFTHLSSIRLTRQVTRSGPSNKRQLTKARAVLSNSKRSQATCSNRNSINRRIKTSNQREANSSRDECQLMPVSRDRYTNRSLTCHLWPETTKS